MALVIGLTGNIGCGKSTVGALLQGLGADYVDADSVVHKLLDRGALTSEQVKERFGARIVRPDGAIDRRALGALVFRDPALLADLERILHPGVRAELRRRIASTQHDTIVVDAIKLIESGFAAETDSVWVVTCTSPLQRERLIRDRGYSVEEADSRIAAQSSQDEKVSRAHVVIENTGTSAELEERVRNAYHRLLAERRAKSREPAS